MEISEFKTCFKLTDYFDVSDRGRVERSQSEICNEPYTNFLDILLGRFSHMHSITLNLFSLIAKVQPTEQNTFGV